MTRGEQMEQELTEVSDPEIIAAIEKTLGEPIAGASLRRVTNDFSCSFQSIGTLYGDLSYIVSLPDGIRFSVLDADKAGQPLAEIIRYVRA